MRCRARQDLPSAQRVLPVCRFARERCRAAFDKLFDGCGLGLCAGSSGWQATCDTPGEVLRWQRTTPRNLLL